MFQKKDITQEQRRKKKKKQTTEEGEVESLGRECVKDDGAAIFFYSAAPCRPGVESDS